MRGIKVRSLDTLAQFSAAVASDTSVGGVKEMLDAKLALAGGIMTGPLVLSADAGTALGATTLQQTESLIATAINNLIGGAVGTLDTLQEIATALNNDASVITGLQTLINTKADLSGAAFTGAVTVPSNTSNPNAVPTLGDVQALIASIASPTFASTDFTLSGSEYSLATVAVAGDYAKVTIDAKGRVTAGTTLTETDLPAVTPNLGSIFSGSAVGLAAGFNLLQSSIQNITASANVGLTNTIGNTFVVDLLPVSGLTTGEYSKVTVDQFGRVTLGALLTETDLPNVTPVAGPVFTGSAQSIATLFNQLQAAAAGGSVDALEDLHTGDGSTATFNFSNIDSSVASYSRRLLVFLDGIRQPFSTYVVSATSVQFVTAPAVGVDIELLYMK